MTLSAENAERGVNSKQLRPDESSEINARDSQMSSLIF